MLNSSYSKLHEVKELPLGMCYFIHDNNYYTGYVYVRREKIIKYEGPNNDVSRPY